MAAVATRTQGPSSNPTSRISSPVDPKRNVTSDDSKRNASPKVANRDVAKASPKKTNATSRSSVTSQPKPTMTDSSSNNNTTSSSSAATAAATTASSTNPPQTARAPSLPPPPPPAVVEEPPSDYFSAVHHNKYGEEPNPFEQSFSVNDGITPGKALLPPASSITLSSPNLGGSTFNWGLNSLRSGPLSPAMLTGPSVFDPSIRAGLTPNESGIRSGLTPGGGGSMFPVPSPGAAGLFGFGSGTTPGTMEFHKTALAAQAQSTRAKFDKLHVNPVTKIEDDDSMNKLLQASPVKLNPPTKPTHGRQASDPFGGGDANAAASGLYMLAQQGQQHQNENNQYVGGNFAISMADVVPGQISNNGHEPDTSMGTSNKRGSITSKSRRQSTIANGRGISEGSEGTDNSNTTDGVANGRNVKTKPTPNKKTPAKNGAGTRRKTDADVKGPPAKKQKQKSLSLDGMDDDDDVDMMMMDDDGMDDKNDGPDSKKMTDDEKRKNFLERNRVAALKCRQRKKQWLANLQAKVEYYGAENDALHSQVANLRDEVIQLKTLLLAHKECPVNRSAAVQGLAGVDGIGAMGQGSEYAMNHSYGVAQANMAPPGRRFS